MDGLSKFREVTGYSNEQLEKMTGYTRQGLNKAFKKMQEGSQLQTKTRIILAQVIDQKIAEETAAYEKRIEELNRLKESLRYDYEASECKVLPFAR